MPVLEQQPWRALPAEAADVLRPVMPALADEIVQAVAREVPAYARPLEGSFGRGIRVGVEWALERFVDLIADPDSEVDRGREMYVQLGRGEWREGRSLDALLAAYRLGARIAWRRTSEAGREAGLEPEVLYQLAEAIFAYIDGLSAESVEGYAAEQSAAAGERQRRRRTLARLLMSEPPAEPAAIADAATRVNWPVPQTLGALVVAGDADAEQLAGRLGGDVLAAGDDGEAICLVPDPDGPGRRDELDAALGDLRAALGPTVAPAEAARSTRWARAAFELAADPADGSLVVAAEHLPALVLRADTELASELATRALAPFQELKPAARERLSGTLRAWLDHQGRVEETARVLHVHPQTVRYRMGQLRDLLGDALEDPERRFELALALRVSRRAPAEG